MGFPTHINIVKNLILSRSKLYNNNENERKSENHLDSNRNEAD